MELAWTEALSVAALAVALAACTGIRAWLPLLLAGGLARLHAFELGPDFQFLASDRALALFAAATLLEVVGDKIPAVDHALDALSTVLRPAAGALLAAAVLGRISEPLTALALGVALGAPASLVPHGAKAALRTLSSGFTGGLANPALSVLEDVLAVVMFLLAIVVPVLLLAGLLALTWLALRRLRARPRPATS